MRTVLILTSLLLASCSPQPAVTGGTVPDLDGVFEFSILSSSSLALRSMSSTTLEKRCHLTSTSPSIPSSVVAA